MEFQSWEEKLVALAAYDKQVAKEEADRKTMTCLQQFNILSAQIPMYFRH